MKHRILVLGGTGMLGSMVTDYLSRDPGVKVTSTARNPEAAAANNRLPNVDWRTFDALTDNYSESIELEEYDWVINCIGIIKPLIHDDNAAEIERAIRVNSLFPHLLARLTVGRAQVLQIATDCVYSGSKGRYTEDDPHDPADVYGKTKSLGEVYAANFHHLRCSIIGPERDAPKSLMEWFLGQPRDSSVNGFVNHSWNGITTLHFAKLCAGIINKSVSLSHVHHIIPSDSVTKYEMLMHFARLYGREDITTRPTEAATVIDRTLTTVNERLNNEIWAAAGYSDPPTVNHMIGELSRFDYQSKVQSG